MDEIKSCVDCPCGSGDGDRETMPETILGFPMERRTVSKVFSILRRDRESNSCFLREIREGSIHWKVKTYLDERFPRLDSSKIHSWFPEMQRLHGGPCSAPTHFILRRRHTVQALEDGQPSDRHESSIQTHREPRVGFGFGSSFSAAGL